MTSRVIDLRLRKLEQKASQSALSHLTDAQLDAQILGTLSIVAAPLPRRCTCHDRAHARRLRSDRPRPRWTD